MTYHDDEQMYDAMIDLAAGRLDRAEAKVLERRIDAEPALAQEYAGVAVLVRDLESYGDAMVASLPEIDVVDAVTSRVAAMEPGDMKMVPFATVEKPRPRMGAWAAAAAIAAALIAAVWLGMRESDQPPPQDLARPLTSHDDSPLQEVESPHIARVDTVEAGAPATPGGEPAAPQMPPTAPDADELSMLAKHDITADAIIEQRQAAARNDEEARNVLARWAALSPENARSVLADTDVSTDAIVGAALSLGGADAAPYLQDAVARNPEDPYLNLELAKATGDPTKPELDEENALGWYVYARQMLSSDPPNLSEALKALETAKSYTKAHAYTLEAAQYHEQALIASGMSEDAARLAAAFTSGPSEYNEMVALGNDLLSYAQYFQELGDSDAALIITESVQRFGEQLDVGALFSHERFAGLELQDTALNFLETMYGGERTESLVQNMEAVAAGFNRLVSFIGNFNSFLTQSLPNDLWRFVADIILQQGDLQIFNNLPQTPQE